MRYVFAVLAAVVLLAVLLILLVPVHTVVTFRKNPSGRGLEIDVKIAFVKFKIYPSDKDGQKHSNKKKIIKEQPKQSKKSVFESISSGIELYKLIKGEVGEILDYTSRKAVRFELIRFNLRYGVGDAAKTGILYGVISGILYGMLANISNRTTVDETDISIVSEFSAAVLETDGKCIVKLQNVHIIVIAVKLFKLYRTVKKGKESD